MKPLYITAALGLTFAVYFAVFTIIMCANL